MRKATNEERQHNRRIHEQMCAKKAQSRAVYTAKNFYKSIGNRAVRAEYPHRDGSCFVLQYGNCRTDPKRVNVRLEWLSDDQREFICEVLELAIARNDKDCQAYVDMLGQLHGAPLED